MPSLRRWWNELGQRLDRAALGLLAVHLVGQGLDTLCNDAIPLVGSVTGVAGFIAVPVAALALSRRVDRRIDTVSWPALQRLAALIVTGVALVALAPSAFHTLRGLPLPVLGRIFQLLTALLSIAVMTGLVLLGFAAADAIYLATSGVRRISTRLMILLLVASLWTFLWLSLSGLEGEAVLRWAVTQGHLERYIAKADLWERIGGAYVGAIAGVLSLQLPFMLILAWRFGRKSTQQLDELRLAFERVRGGVLEPIAVRGVDEVAEMQRGFNAMLDAVRERRFLELAFGRYVSPHVLDKLRAAPEGAGFAGERLVATVLFADIRGFTAMSAEREPEEVIELLNKYMARMIAVIDAHGGYINKFIGDAIMVVWNTPVADPEHALRACACAAAMQRALADANAARTFGDVRIEIGIGINTGALVAGTLGDQGKAEFTVLGDTVNVASRACSKAPAGVVALTAGTVEAARAVAVAKGVTVDVGELGVVELKGKGPTPLYTLTSPLSSRA